MNPIKLAAAFKKIRDKIATDENLDKAKAHWGKLVAHAASGRLDPGMTDAVLWLDLQIIAITKILKE